MMRSKRKPKFSGLQEYLDAYSVRDESGCINWSGYVDKAGYGRGRLNGKSELAHRVAYFHAQGHLPTGLEIDHLCRNRRCINPDHLEAVTKLVNGQRGVGVGAINAKKSTCIEGHPFDPANTRLRTNGARECRICVRRRWNNHFSKNREKILARNRAYYFRKALDERGSG